MLASHLRPSLGYTETRHETTPVMVVTAIREAAHALGAGVFLGSCANGGESMTKALFNDNRLKLGVFGLNVSNGCAATTAEGHLQPTWQNNVDIAVMADGHSSSCSPPLSSRCLRCLISLYEFRTTRGIRSDGDNKPAPRQRWFYN